MKSRFLALIILAVLFQLNSNTLASEPPSVTEVQTKRVDQKTGIGYAALGEQVTLGVNNLEILIAESIKTGKKIIPYLNGLPFSGVETFQMERDKGNIFFILKRSDKSKESWRALIQQRDKKDHFFSETVDVSVGLEDGVPISSKAKFQLIVISRD